MWLFFAAPAKPAGFGWFLFSFAAGISMIVLPCTLPLAFVIVPLSMGKGIKKGLSIALAFGAGVAITLSLYGVAAALVGKFAIDSLGAPLETVKNWVYFIAGIFALLFAIGEIGLVKVRMPSYTGAAPGFIQKQRDVLKALLLGLFLGNIGVGCPHPATPLILIEIASSGDVIYGWTLFFIHAVGRVLPLLFLAFLGILGVNGLTWLVARKDKVERATGWAMVFVAGFILTLGLFTHDWWVNSGIHTQFEKITQEEQLLNIVRDNLNSTVTHSHDVETGTGLFGLPLWLGNWFLVALWIIPVWWWWRREKKRVREIPESNTISEKVAMQKTLSGKKYLFITLSVLLALTFIYVLPQKFLNEASEPHLHEPGTPENHDHSEMKDADEHGGAAPADDMNDHMMEMMEDSDHMENMMGHGDHEGGIESFYEEKDVTDGFVVLLDAGQKTIISDTPVILTFTAQELPQHNPVLNLELSHEKYMHVIGMRDDLNEFFHVHPTTRGGGIWTVQYTFKKPGTYKIWTDVTR